MEEWQIFRIDHFLGKGPAVDIMFLRFCNSIFEPVWNRDRIQSVQITMAEDFGVEDRGRFYDPVGALRDVVQNHLLQLIGLFASEPASVGDADGLRDKRVEVFRAISPADPNHYVRGQYDGYHAMARARLAEAATPTDLSDGRRYFNSLESTLNSKSTTRSTRVRFSRRCAQVVMFSSRAALSRPILRRSASAVTA